MIERSQPNSATPTPWEAQPFGDGEDGVGILGLPLNGLVAWVTMFPTEMDANDPTRAKANAALIVKAVNNHDALVKALEKLRSYNVDIAAGRINYRPHDHIQVIDDALAGLENQS